MGAARTLAEQGYAAMQRGDIEALTRLLSPTCELHDLGLTMRGPEQIGQYLQTFFTAFPDIRIEVLSMLEEGNRVAAEVRFTGVQIGPLALPSGELPASGKKIDLQAADIFTMEDGQVTQWRVYMDSLTFMRQLGLLPEPAQAAAV